MGEAASGRYWRPVGSSTTRKESCRLLRAMRGFSGPLCNAKIGFVLQIEVRRIRGLGERDELPGTPRSLIGSLCSGKNASSPIALSTDIKIDIDHVSKDDAAAHCDRAGRRIN